MGTNSTPRNFWNGAHRDLMSILQKEINLMREILANMHQEELSLLTYDKEEWTKVMEERSDMIVKLKDLRLERLKQAKDLKILFTQKVEEKNTLRIEIFPLEIDTSSEILSLLDQLIALIDRMNLQNCRNEFLFHQVKNLTQIPLHCPYPPPHLQPASKRATRNKTSIATYPPKQ